MVLLQFQYIGTSWNLQRVFFYFGILFFVGFISKFYLNNHVGMYFVLNISRVLDNTFAFKTMQNFTIPGYRLLVSQKMQICQFIISVHR